MLAKIKHRQAGRETYFESATIVLCLAQNLVGGGGQ